MPLEEGDVRASILISVSKRRFKRAVKRNRVKRQIREAYRLNKQPLLQVLESRNHSLAIAFIYLSDRLMPSSLLMGCMQTALARIAENISAES